jgi:hypothetical protein
VLLAFGCALAVFLASRRWWRVAVVALGVLIVGEVLHVVGSWSAVASSFAGRFGAEALSIGAIAVAVVSLVKAARASATDAAPWLLVGAVTLVVAGGIGGVTTWWRSQLPSSLPDSLTRALVALAFAGLGIVLVAATRLRPATDAARTAPASAPAESPAH